MRFDASMIILLVLLPCACAWAFDLASRAKERSADALAAQPIPAAQRPSLASRAREMLAPAFIPLLIVLCARVAAIEPFRIPSGSMMPGLVAGDFIVVDKHVWGVRLPWSDKLILAPSREPARGDVAVFRYPRDESTDFIKRLVGLPGDTVRYESKRLTINGARAQYAEAGLFADPESARAQPTFAEKLPGESGAHQIATEASPDGVFPFGADSASSRSCRSLGAGGFECVVPAGQYLAMGDNRDHSADSRYWGFVPRQNLIGRAVYVWMSLKGLSRIGPIS